MDKREVLIQGNKALNEMLQAKEKYSKMREKYSFSGTLFELTLDGFDSGGCCLVTLVGLPCLLLWQFEKRYLEKKASRIMLPAQTECKLYLQYLQEFLRMYPDNRINMSASSAFVRNTYLGTLTKKKIIFGLFNEEEDWRIRSIEMAIQELKFHLQLLDTQSE